MKTITIVLFLLQLTLSTYAQRNVIVIIADDLSPDYFGFYPDHGDTVDVPNIRALAERGVVFTNGMSNPVCSATRAGILTGRYSFRTGVGGIVGGTGGSNPIDTAEVTIPRMLKAKSPQIATADIGKWHLSNPMAANLSIPNRMGYDHFEGPFIGQLPSYVNWTKVTNGVSSTVTTYATTESVNNAVSWLKSQSTRQFFLWLAFNAPHTPMHLPPNNLHSYSNLTGTTQDIRQRPKEYLKAMLQALDHEIGRLFDSLTVMGKMDSTDIIFIGDNGNTPTTAQTPDTSRAKGTIYQYGVHVPFLVAGPSVVSPNRISNALVNTADIFATTLDIMRGDNWQSSIPVSKPIDSKSFLPILQQQKTEIRSWTFCENFKLTPDAEDGKALRTRDYKLIRFDTGKEEFYHLASDSLETKNLLLRSLSKEEQTGYDYLCNEMFKLLGKGKECSTSDVGSAEFPSLVVSPNPFSSRITFSLQFEPANCRLVNSLGQLIYQGDSIETEDFSYLPVGPYALTCDVGSTKIRTVLVKVRE